VPSQWSGSVYRPIDSMAIECSSMKACSCLPTMRSRSLESADRLEIGL